MEHVLTMANLKLKPSLFTPALMLSSASFAMPSHKCVSAPRRAFTVICSSNLVVLTTVYYE